ncbi:MAG TPA: hypothetical protein VLS89_15570 [Candidatus Nanopelagicales bacterium]|nr:hypothetical protein [Candidatus Nanopelagicales bacterium]
MIEPGHHDPTPRRPARGAGTPRAFSSFAIVLSPSPAAYRRKISRTISACPAWIRYSTRTRRSPSLISTFS